MTYRIDYIITTSSGVHVTLTTSVDRARRGGERTNQLAGEGRSKAGSRGKGERESEMESRTDV